MVAGSEPEKSFRSFALANHNFDHMYLNLSDQLCSRACTLHPGCTGCTSACEPDLLIMGTPCNPFSIQRGKRFKGTVLDHHLSDHTFTDSYKMLEMFQPIHAVFEQTDGFGKPIEAGSNQTPLQMFLDSSILDQKNSFE